VFATGLPGHWVQYNNHGPFPSGVRCRPARVIDLGFIGAWQQASDAERVSDMNSQTDQMALARTVASCALMGMLSVGTAKGYVASDNHSELTLAKADANARAGADDDDDEDDESQSKLKRRLNGTIRTYTYCPNADHVDENKRRQTAMMFCYVHIAMHDRQGKYVGFKILMLIFDKGFSTDLLVSKVMEENAKIKANGLVNGMPEDQRNGRFERQNKLQRAQINDDNLETSAQLQSRRICDNQNWLSFMESVGGATDGNEGRPYYGCGNNRLYVSKMGHWCLTNDPSQMHTNQLAQEPPGNVGMRFHPGTNVGLVASGGATGKGWPGPQFLPPQVRWWGIWNGQRFVKVPNARFADAGGAAPVPSFAPPPPAAPVAVESVQPVVVEAVPMALAAPPSLGEMCAVFKDQLGVSGTMKEVVEAAAEALGVEAGKRPLTEVAKDCYGKLGMGV